MAVVRFTQPDMSDFKQDVSDLFAEFFGQSQGQNLNWNPLLDLSETRDEYLVRMELPGVKKENIRINLKENVLQITGEKKRAGSDDEYFRSECCYGKFQRSVLIPGEINRSQIEAQHENGILTIKLKKSEEKKAKQIEIK